MPAIVVGTGGELLLVAPAAEQALGWRCDSVGSSWIERVAPGAAGSAHWFINRTLSGALRKFEIEVLTARGAALARFESYAIGSRDDRGVLLLLEHLAPLASERPAEDFDYEVRGVADGSYSLGRLWRLGSERSHDAGTCYQILHGRTVPCEPCPLLSLAQGSVSPLLVRHCAPHDYELMRASASSHDVARISVRRLPLASFSAILQAKLDELAARAGLSKRERAVFGFLMDGRAVEEIASELTISPRTVKFHQANLLQKLGADSRTDLMRLVF